MRSRRQPTCPVPAFRRIGPRIPQWLRHTYGIRIHSILHQCGGTFAPLAGNTCLHLSR